MTDGREKTRGLFDVDPSIPRWFCQKCRHPSLSIVGAESRSGVETLSMRGPDIHGRKAIDESFVVWTEADAPVYRNENSPLVGGLRFPNFVGNSSSAQHTENPIFYSRQIVLKRAFDIVSSQTKIEQPLCLECMRVISEKLDRENEDINRDIKAYEACLNHLEKESSSGLSEANFYREKEKVEEQEKNLEAAMEEIEKQCMDFRHQLQELELKSKRFEELDKRFWHEMNDYRLQITSQQEERDAIIAKIDVTQTQLEQLKHINVLNDAFYICHDSDFGAINDFRLSRVPNKDVEWDEINAAWGQACLLLHTMAIHSGAKFSYQITPMGSYPCIVDTKKNKYELFGPVNLLWSTLYDKAINFFLICLKEFGDYANAKDTAGNILPERRFKFPKMIEIDKVRKSVEVEKIPIVNSLRNLHIWTKALKFVLCDLKWAQHWFIANSDFLPPGAPATSSSASSASSSHSEANSQYNK